MATFVAAASMLNGGAEANVAGIFGNFCMPLSERAGICLYIT